VRFCLFLCLLFYFFFVTSFFISSPLISNFLTYPGTKREPPADIKIEENPTKKPKKAQRPPAAVPAKRKGTPNIK
jgi:hypothetical protein